MKLSLCLALCLTVQVVELAAVTPVSKVLQLLSSLESKIMKDGEAEEKLFQDYMDWCKTAKDELIFFILKYLFVPLYCSIDVTNRLIQSNGSI